MGLVPCRGFEVHDRASVVRSAMGAWKPSIKASRKDLIEDLKVFLDKHMEGPTVKVNEKVGRIQPDLLIAEEVIMYVFPKPDQKIKEILKRIEDIQSWKAVLMLVLVGATSDETLEQIDDLVNRINNDFEFTSHQAIVIVRK
jgi:hypothetical protein